MAPFPGKFLELRRSTGLVLPYVPIVLGVRLLQVQVIFRFHQAWRSSYPIRCGLHPHDLNQLRPLQFLGVPGLHPWFHQGVRVFGKGWKADLPAKNQNPHFAVVPPVWILESLHGQQVGFGFPWKGGYEHPQTDPPWPLQAVLPEQEVERAEKG